MNNDDTTDRSFWDLLENPAENVTSTTELLHWSMNYGSRSGTPYHIFLDLIGYSDEHFGMSIFTGNPRDVLGYLELSYLADALKEYAENPQAVSDWIDLLDAAEARDAESEATR
jgi:hypothetical protein